MAASSQVEVIDIGSSSEGEQDDGDGMSSEESQGSDVSQDREVKPEQRNIIRSMLIDDTLKKLRDNYDFLKELTSEMSQSQLQRWNSIVNVKPQVADGSSSGLVTLRPSVFSYANQDGDREQSWSPPPRRPVPRRAPTRRKKARKTYRRPKVSRRQTTGKSSATRTESKPRLLANCARAAASMKARISKVKTESRSGGKSGCFKVKSER